MTIVDNATLIKRAVAGGSLTTLHFLKSKEAAERVADRVWAKLREKPRYAERGREQAIRIKPSEMFPGTWDLRIPLPGIQRRTYSSRATLGTNQPESNEAKALLRSCFTGEDLVSTYEFPSRRR